MFAEQRGPAICDVSNVGEGKDEMTKASIDLQDLRRRIYVKAKAEPSWRFWGLYVHVCKIETLRAAYEMAKRNDGAPGIDGGTFEAIGAPGVDALLEQLRDELIVRTSQPLLARRQEIPKDGGKVRVLSIPAIRDRVVQGALKLILEPVFEADFQPGSFGYRPKRTAHDAIKRVAEAIVRRKTRVLDFDLRAYFDNVRHDRLLAKVAQRIDDADIMHLLKVMLKASGKKGVPQGGVMAPRTQKVTLRSRQWSVRTAGWRAVARCHGQRDAVPDDDLVVADEDFLDEKPQDALAFQYLEGPRRRPQSRKERGQRFSEAQVGCAVD